MASERYRLKDQLLDQISKAVKEVQMCSFGQDGEEVVITNANRPLQKLAEHLDHAFLHGLRHISPGYWAMMQLFTHHDLIHDIRSLDRITTDLGRSRAWLYQSLNDHAMESYINCFLQNPATLRKYYIDRAFLRDTERTMLFQTLISGLDFVTFQLELNIAFFDLVSHVPRSATERQNLADEISLHSCDSLSVLSPSEDVASPLQQDVPSSILENIVSDLIVEGKEIPAIEKVPQAHVTVEKLVHDPNHNEDEDSAGKNQSSQVDSDISQKGLSTDLVRPTSLPLPTANGKPWTHPSSFDLGNKIKDLDFDDTLEVIHVKERKSKKSQKKRKSSVRKTTPDQRSSRSSSIHSTTSETDSIQDTVLVVSNEIAGTENLGKLENQRYSKGSDVSKENVYSEALTASSHHAASFQSNDCDSVHSGDFSHGNTPESVQASQEKEEESQSMNDVTDNFMDMLDTNRINCDLESKLEPNNNPQAVTIENALSDNLNNISNSPGDQLDSLQNVVTSSQSPSQQEVLDTLSYERLLSFSSSSGVFSSPTPEKTLPDDQESIATTESAVSLEDIKSPGDGASEDNLDEEGESVTGSNGNGATDVNGAIDIQIHPCIMRVDNNLKLHFMLEVFASDREEFQQFFKISTCHTEGEVQPGFLLLTDTAVYLLRNSEKKKRYRVARRMEISNIKMISVSMDLQVMSFMQHGDAPRLQVCTCDEKLSRLIFANMKEITSSNSHSTISIKADGSKHKNKLQAWAAQECRVKSDSIKLLLYSLVHWDDVNNPSIDPDLHMYQPPRLKAGYMNFKTKETRLLGSFWQPGFFELRGHVICRFAEKGQKKPQWTMQLCPPDFVGCSRVRQKDRQCCFELRQRKRPSHVLACESEKQMSDWLEVICQVLAEQQMAVMNNKSPVLPVQPCCSLVTSHKLLLFHEDNQTKFLRCLASCDVVSVAYIKHDPQFTRFLLLEFIKSESETPWLLYFQTGYECKRFTEALSKAVFDASQIELPVDVLVDEVLRTRVSQCLSAIKASQKNVIRVDNKEDGKGK